MKTNFKQINKFTIFALVSILILGLCFFSLAACGSNGSNSSVQSSQSTEHKSDAGYATMEKFNQIQNGMTYAQVQQIMGSAGEVMSDSEIAGYKTTIYVWKAKDGISNMNVTIQNDAVQSKAQVGLK